MFSVVELTIKRDDVARLPDDIDTDGASVHQHHLIGALIRTHGKVRGHRFVKHLAIATRRVGGVESIGAEPQRQRTEPTAAFHSVRVGRLTRRPGARLTTSASVQVVHGEVHVFAGLEVDEPTIGGHVSARGCHSHRGQVAGHVRELHHVIVTTTSGHRVGGHLFNCV